MSGTFFLPRQTLQLEEIQIQDTESQFSSCISFLPTLKLSKKKKKKKKRKKKKKERKKERKKKEEEHKREAQEEDEADH